MIKASELRLRKLPIWQGGISITPLRGGLSNDSYLVTDGTGRHVARFGEDYPFHHVYREAELMTTRAAAEAGFGPTVEYSEPGLMVLAFMDGKVLAPEDVRSNPARIAELLRRFHMTMPKLVTGAARFFWVFHVIRDYARILRIGGSRMLKELPYYLALADELEAAQIPQPIIFGHNDLLPSNLIETPDRIWLIDFEYAAYSTPMFDLAGVASNSGMSDEQSEVLLTAYYGEKPGPDLLRSHLAMQCASLLREAMWSMVSEIHLARPGVNYVTYTAENLTRLRDTLASYRERFPR